MCGWPSPGGVGRLPMQRGVHGWAARPGRGLAPHTAHVAPAAESRAHEDFWPAEQRSGAPAAQLVEPDEGLAVLAGVDGPVKVGERPADELDALVLLHGRLVDVAQARGEVQVQLLVAEADGRPVGLEVLPMVRRLADL